MPDQDNAPDPDHFAAANAMLGGDSDAPNDYASMVQEFGVHPGLWALAFSQKLGGPALSAMVRDCTEVEVMTPWFKAAIEAGRKAGYVLAQGTPTDHVADALAYGIGITKDGERIAPEDFYAAPDADDVITVPRGVLAAAAYCARKHAGADSATYQGISQASLKPSDNKRLAFGELVEGLFKQFEEGEAMVAQIGGFAEVDSAGITFTRTGDDRSYTLTLGLAEADGGDTVPL